MMRNSWVIAAALAALLGACRPAPDAGTSPTPTPTAPSASAQTTSPTMVACPADATPDDPGDPNQPRPALPDPNLLAAADPTRPRIVVGETGFVPEGAGMPTLQSTWAFDVCTNTWRELSDASLPAPDQRPALAQLVTDPQAGVVLGLPYWWTPVWTFDPATDSWRAPEGDRAGFETWPDAVYDSAGDRLLAFDPWGLTGTGATDSGVRAYNPEARAWTELELADPAQEKPKFTPEFDYHVAFDSAAGRLVLVVTPPGSDEPAQTWVFDPVARSWSRGAEVPQALADGYPSEGWATAFDPATSRTWWFADTAMLGYSGIDDDWAVAARDAGWPDSMMLGGVEADPTARVVSTMVPDPANGRLVVIGGKVRRVDDPVGGFVWEGDLLATDDVWAYDPTANTWTMLLAPSGAPASYGPG